jgi:putative sigma-54 modulation protein
VRIEIVGRNVEVTDEMRELAEKRFDRVARQVSDLARLAIVIREESNPAIRDRFQAEASLHLKGRTLHAQESAADPFSAIRGLSHDLKRQVKRNRELRRKRATTRRLVGRMRRNPAA